MTESFIELTECANRINVHRRTIERHIKRGNLKAKKIGRKYFITESSFNNFMGLPENKEPEQTPDKKDEGLSPEEAKKIWNDFIFKYWTDKLKTFSPEMQKRFEYINDENKLMTFLFDFVSMLKSMNPDIFDKEMVEEIAPNLKTINQCRIIQEIELLDSKGKDEFNNKWGKKLKIDLR